VSSGANVTEVQATDPHPVARVRAPIAPAGWPAWRLREAIAAHELAASEVVRAHLDRLDEVAPALNAVARDRRAEALQEARALDQRLASGAEPGVLCGVPITVKDVIATAGTETSCGSAAFAGNVPAVDAVAVARLRAAGAIVIAKSNCPEFGFGITTESVVYGITRSPWGAHSPGGSSGGEAALIAAGASALGLGTDYGGSVRWPAQCCGILALRPGVGSVDPDGQLPESGGRIDGRSGPAGPVPNVQRMFQVIGPIARTVRDLALAFSAMAGRPLSRDESWHRERVGWVSGDGTVPVGADAQAAVRLAADALAGPRTAVEAASGRLDGLHAAFNALRDTDPLDDHRAAVGPRQALLGPGAAALLAAAPVSAADPGPLRERLDQLRSRVLTQLQRTPVLIAPVAPVAACELDGTALVEGVRRSGFELMAQCRAVSALGFPALSIPVGRDRRGLPLSVQVVAGPGGEELVLAVGLRLEQLLGGAQQPPWLPS
jgi:amidase